MLSHLIRLSSSGEINSDFSIHLGRTNQSTTLQLHEALWHQISRLLVQPLPVATLGALWYQILLQCLDLFLHLRTPCFGTHSTPSGALSVRPHWMDRPVCAHASHLAGLSLRLHPQRFEGDVVESSTTTSEHDGTTRTCIHAMNDTTPVVCVKLKHHVHKLQSFKDFTASQHTVLPRQNSKQCAVEPDNTQR